MSRFFRSASSSSSSAESEDTNEEGTSLSQSESELITRPPPTNVNHRDLLLHALLEERCFRQTRDELGESADASQVGRTAHTAYQNLSQQLAAYGLIEPGLDHKTFSTQRQAVRDGLDALSQGSTRSVEAGTERPDPEIAMNAVQLFRPQITLSRQSPLTDMLLTLEDPGFTSNTLFSSSRYAREFEEVRILGKGGYGMVFQCKHRFDGLSYAVKKVPFSSSRLVRIREQGQAEIDRLLLELTTLAKLDHPNIVRYFGGWVEMATFYDNAQIADANPGASEHSISRAAHRVAEVTDDNFILFEDTSLQRSSTRNTQPSIGDVESIDRSASIDLSTLSTFTQNTTPCLALHIQMGLYPLTLADLLTDTPPRHCFHIEPSLRILTALIEGVIYLHSQAIVHRDLKPANIFLAHQHHQKGWCQQCCTTAGFKARIGDFGLVAALAQQDSDDYTVPVGTELYRPLSIDRVRLEALDWFALGIVAFELLWPFATRMERHETLSAIKAGLFPFDLEQRLGVRSAEVARLIEYLLHGSLVEADELRLMLTSMLARCHNT